MEEELKGLKLLDEEKSKLEKILQSKQKDLETKAKKQIISIGLMFFNLKEKISSRTQHKNHGESQAT